MSNNPFTRKNSYNPNTNFNSGILYRDENITKYTTQQNSTSNVNMYKPPVANSITREFGRDLTNIMPFGTSLSQREKKFIQVPGAGNNNKKLLNMIKPTKKEKEDLKKQLTRNDSSLYNLRPRTNSSMNNSKVNSNNNSFSLQSNNHNQNENVNTMNTMNTMNVKMSKVNNDDDMEVDQIMPVPKPMPMSRLVPIPMPLPQINKDINLKTHLFNKDPFTHSITTQPLTYSNNPQNVLEYLNDIYEHCKETELTNYPRYGYMKSQRDINEKMRAILIDWLVDVHLKFKLVPETLFLTTQIIDKFLARVEINRNRLQLVGVTALFIASKYEEIYPPELKDFVYITDKAYSKVDILTMEKEILNELNFDITYPSALRFLEIYYELINIKFEDQIPLFTHYLLELFLIEYKMIKYPPSLIAASTLYITLKVKKPNVIQVVDIPSFSGYTEDKLKECARDIIVILDYADKSSLQAVRNKYSLPKFLEVAKWKKV